MAIVIAVIYGVRNSNKPSLASVDASNPKSFTANQLKEEFEMEKETKVIKEKVNTETSSAKIERVAAAKVHEEIADELAPLRSQLQSIQHSLSQLDTNQQNVGSSSNGQAQLQSNDLLKQMQQFSSQAQQQQQKTFQQLQQSIHQATQTLTSVEQSLQSINMLNQISQQIDQSQQQLQQQYQQQSSSQNPNNQTYQQ
jgi:chromosome segregation ATPase